MTQLSSNACGGAKRGWSFVRVGLALLGLFLAQPRVLAGSVSEPENLQEPGWLFEFPISIINRNAMDSLESDSSVPSGTIYRLETELPYFFPLSETWRLIGGFSVAAAAYEDAPFSDDGLTTWGLDAFVSVEIDLAECWTGTVGLLGSSGFEEGADFGESLGGGALVAAGYRWSNTLRTSLGALYLSRTNDDAIIVPAIGLAWQATEQLLVLIRGLEASAAWSLSEHWTLVGRSEVRLDSAWLKDRANTRAANFTDDSFRVGVGVEWRPNDYWTLALDGGGVWHESRLLDADNNELSSARISGPYMGLTVSAKF